MKDQVLSIIDLETTGCSFKHDRILEIGLIQIKNGKIIERFTTVLNPEMETSSFILNLTGIEKTEIENAPTFDDIKDDLFAKLKGTIFIAHNVRFDYGFIKQEFKRHKIDFMSKTLCSVRLSRKLYPNYKKHNLDTIINRFNLSCERRHRALDDAIAVKDFFDKATEELGQEVFQKALQELTHQISLPPNLKRNKLAHIPDTPGVYIFYGQTKHPLYIGKSIQLKTRILSHFSSANISSKENQIFRSVEKVDYTETHGELGALILESKLIKEMMPLYNRKLRRSRALGVIYETESEEGYKMAILKKEKEIPVTNLKNVITSFSTFKKAETFLNQITTDFQLCPHLITKIRKRKEACFNYHLKQCHGACLTEENATSYNQRFTQAFNSIKIRSWPFNGSILIYEESEDKEVGNLYLFNNWALVAEGTYYQDTYQIQKTDQIIFDRDIYKILRTYLKKRKNHKILSTTETEQFLNC